jgi:hypothetical protein
MPLHALTRQFQVVRLLQELLLVSLVHPHQRHLQAMQQQQQQQARQQVPLPLLLLNNRESHLRTAQDLQLQAVLLVALPPKVVQWALQSSFLTQHRQNLVQHVSRLTQV